MYGIFIYLLYIYHKKSTKYRYIDKPYMDLTGYVFGLELDIFRSHTAFFGGGKKATQRNEEPPISATRSRRDVFDAMTAGYRSSDFDMSPSSPMKAQFVEVEGDFLGNKCCRVGWQVAE